jgi:hypothetical protein
MSRLMLTVVALGKAFKIGLMSQMVSFLSVLSSAFMILSASSHCQVLLQALLKGNCQ